MKKHTIDSIETYLSKIDVFYEEHFVFRGVSDFEKHKLIPSAGRYEIKNEEHQKQFELYLLKDFKRKAPLFTEKAPRNNLEWLILGQHHGLPTRLLDWTFNPLVALFFAIEARNKKAGAVYLSEANIDPNGLNMIEKEHPLGIKEVKFVVPELNHVRYNNQNGLFTILPNPGEEDLSFVEQVLWIPAMAKPSIRKKLSKVGINRSLLFPGLDSIASDVTQMNIQTYKGYLGDDINDLLHW